MKSLRQLLEQADRQHHADREHELQAACVKWFRLRFPHWAHSLFAVPNGGRRSATTGARLKAEGVLAGVADLILLQARHGAGALLIEMKAGTGRQSPAQRQWQKAVEADGYRYAVCRTFEEFAAAVNDYLQQ